MSQHSVKGTGNGSIMSGDTDLHSLSHPPAPLVSEPRDPPTFYAYKKSELRGSTVFASVRVQNYFDSPKGERAFQKLLSADPFKDTRVKLAEAINHLRPNDQPLRQYVADSFKHGLHVVGDAKSIEGHGTLQENIEVFRELAHPTTPLSELSFSSLQVACISSYAERMAKVISDDPQFRADLAKLLATEPERLLSKVDAPAQSVGKQMLLASCVFSELVAGSVISGYLMSILVQIKVWCVVCLRLL